MSLDKLPEGWADARLAEVCDINPPKPSSDALLPSAPVTFVPMPAVDAAAGAITKAETRAFSAVRKGYTAFQNGDVIMAKITPCMENGKAAIASSLQNGLGFGSTEFHVLRPAGAVVADLVFRFIRQESFRREAESEMTGSVGQKRVPASFLGSTLLPLPPLAEQARITAKIDELLRHVNASREHLAKVPKILKAFRQSVLAAACSGHLTEDWREGHPQHPPSLPINSSRKPLPPIEEQELLFEAPDSWRWSRLGSLAVLINGDRGKSYPNKTEYVPKGIPFINTGHIQPDGSLSWESMHYLTRPKFESLNSGKIQKGDLVYCLRGATLGKTAFVEPYEEGAIASSLVIIRLDKILNKKFIYYLLTSPYGRELVSRFDNGSAQPNLSADSVKHYVCPVPSHKEQQEIVHRVEILLKLADKIERRVEAATKRADRLTQAVLAKAFRGELVPTEAEIARREGRKYESAVALLARIQANKSVNGNRTGKRARKTAGKP